MSTPPRTAISLIAAGLCIAMIVAADHPARAQVHTSNGQRISISLPDEEMVSRSRNGSVVFNKDSCAGKIVLLDFWIKGCVPCIASFPKLQKLSNRYRRNPRFMIRSVYVPMPGARNQLTDSMIASRQHQFPVLEGTNLRKAFEVQSFPTVIILANEKIVFRGDLKEAAAVLKKL